MDHGTLPLVSGNRLFLSGKPEDLSTSIVAESEDWDTWLLAEQNQTFTFQCALGTFTAHRERKHRCWYLYDYRKQAGEQHKAYLGKAEKVTLERLKEAAAVLVPNGDIASSLEVYLRPSRGHISQVPLDLANDKEKAFQHPIPVFNPSAVLERTNEHTLPALLTPLIGREQEAALSSRGDTLQRSRFLAGSLVPSAQVKHEANQPFEDECQCDPRKRANEPSP